MTIKEKNEYKRRAKQAMKENGHKVSMNHMTLLETGGNYIMFEDRKTGR